MTGEEGGEIIVSAPCSNYHILCRVCIFGRTECFLHVCVCHCSLNYTSLSVFLAWNGPFVPTLLYQCFSADSIKQLRAELRFWFVWYLFCDSASPVVHFLLEDVALT